MGEHPVCISTTQDCGLGAAEQVWALREQRRLVDALLEDVARTERRLDIEPGAGAVWQSPTQKAYMLRRQDLRRRVGRVVWLLTEVRESLSVTISDTAHG